MLVFEEHWQLKYHCSQKPSLRSSIATVSFLIYNLLQPTRCNCSLHLDTEGMSYGRICSQSKDILHKSSRCKSDPWCRMHKCSTTKSTASYYRFLMLISLPWCQTKKMQVPGKFRTPRVFFGILSCWDPTSWNLWEKLLLPSTCRHQVLLRSINVFKVRSGF